MSYSAKPKIIFLGTKQPYVCGVCEFVLRDLEDVKSVKEHEACTHCVTMFKHVRGDEWENGWRPSVEEARSS